MLTDDDVIADLARLRERSADIEYDGEVPLTRRSAAATIAPVAALAAVATVGASVVMGHDDGRAPAADRQAAPSAKGTTAAPEAGSPSSEPVELVDAQITLAGKVISYSHPVGKDPFAPGWQLAVVFGDGLPADVTEFTVEDGSSVWVADIPLGEDGKSVLIGSTAADGQADEIYYGLASGWSRAELEEWVRTELEGV